MKSKHIRQLLRLLLIGAGAGAGAALAFLCVQVHRMTTMGAMSFSTLAGLYAGMGALGALLAYLVAPKAVDWCCEMMNAVERHMDDLSTAQMAAMTAGLITGLLIAALLSQVLSFLGDSIFTLAACAALYVVLGATGLSIGKRRTEDFADILNSKTTRRERREMKRHETGPVKVLDSSALIDGRIEAVRRAGFLEGELVLPDFVLEELHHLADSADEAKRLRGRRGLEAAERLKADPAASLRVEAGENEPAQEADVRLLALVRDMGAALVTVDFNLSRAARVAGLTVLNLNDLVCALRPVTAAGDVLSVRVTREGREAGQGVGYLEDGTMLVIEGGRSHVGRTAEVTVTSVLQTSAGRMVFARLNGPKEE